MKTAFLIYPHQLYEQITKLNKDNTYFLVEDPLYFGDTKYPLTFCKKKLLLHRAAMKEFYNFLLDNGFTVNYVDYISDSTSPDVGYTAELANLNDNYVSNCASANDNYLSNNEIPSNDYVSDPTNSNSDFSSNKTSSNYIINHDSQNNVDYLGKNSNQNTNDYLNLHSSTKKLHQSHPKFLLKNLSSQGFKNIIFYDPTDYILSLRLNKYAKKYDLKVQILQSPNFLTSTSVINSYFKDKKHYSMNSFYIFQRKRLNILVDNDKPVGGSWSYDVKNRKKLPKDITLPNEITFSYDKNFDEYKKYVNQHFKNNYGSTDNFNYPINHDQALKQLKHFLKYKFNDFGPYEDAIDETEVYLFHSNLSSSLNIGLLNPDQVINEALKYKDKVSIESLEGFVRQIIGWREFMRATYLLKGTQIRNTNYLKHTKKINKHFYDGTTNIYPVDITIKKVLDTAYCHHIERLMILGNIMLLLQKDPKQVYKWFMEMFIDAYDWVMVANVYSMSQFADGGLITTKPYFSGSNYVLKMSNYKKDDWCHVWDSLFYNFLMNNRDLIKKNPRLSILVKNLDKKTDQEIKEIIKISSIYI